MMNIFKKLFTKKEVKQEQDILNYDLVLKLSDIYYYENFESIFYDPVNKLYLLTVYSTTLDELIQNLYNDKFQRTLSCVNSNHYFKENRDTLKLNIKQIMTHLETIKIPKQIEYDLYEIYNMFDNLTNGKEE